jgi:hypothetical protein
MEGATRNNAAPSDVSDQALHEPVPIDWQVSSTKARHADGAGNNDLVVVWGGLVAVGDDGERRRYRGTVDGVGGEAWMQKINGPPRAVAKIDGVKVGRGGGG